MAMMTVLSGRVCVLGGVRELVDIRRGPVHELNQPLKWDQ